MFSSLQLMKSVRQCYCTRSLSALTPPLPTSSTAPGGALSTYIVSGLHEHVHVSTTLVRLCHVGTLQCEYFSRRLDNHFPPMAIYDFVSRIAMVSLSMPCLRVACATCAPSLLPVTSLWPCHLQPGCIRLPVAGAQLAPNPQYYGRPQRCACSLLGAPRVHHGSTCDCRLQRLTRVLRTCFCFFLLLYLSRCCGLTDWPAILL